MDIKLKNNRKYGWIIVGMITVLFAGIFMAMYPSFKENAQSRERTMLRGTEFLHKLYCSNYVLYKDMMEKLEQTNYQYAELYLDKEVTDWNGDTETSSNYVDEDINQFMQELENTVETSIQIWESQMRDELGHAIDYCVMDNASGEYIKNTGRDIETLIKGGKNAATVANGYEYYVVVSYDAVGNVGQIKVKDTEPDVLLKSVSHVMTGELLENYYSDMDIFLTDGYGQYWGYSEKDDSAKCVEYRLGTPKNVTFVYAMTKEQKILAYHEGITASEWEEWYTYYEIGVSNVYHVMLLLLTGIIFGFMFNKKYDLHRSKFVCIPLEVSVILGLLFVLTFGELVVGLVSNTNRGHFSMEYEQYLPFIPAELYPAVTGVLNFICLSLLFGGWIYIVNSLGGITVLGVKGFLKERSILVKLGRRFHRFCKIQFNILKEELLHVNLGKDTRKILRKAVIVNFVVLAVMCSMWVIGWGALLVYSIALYWILKRYIHRIQEQYQRLLKATESIAEGNLNTTFDEDLGVFESYKEELYQIQQGFRKAVDEEVKSQRMKTELITNVSHDLKTPLTAITTYIDLLKEENLTEEQRQEYIGVLEKKSLRLKTLIEDLFEVSKANSRNVTVNLVDVDICNLIRQVYLEYEDRVEDAGLMFRFRMPQEKVILKLDSQKSYRIFENLYMNIIKYAMSGSRVYVDVEREDNGVRIEMKNMSAVELHVEAQELTERFVRGDSSRNTEGSGLGLAIAKSFVEVQGGKLDICVDGDLFKVTIWFG